MTFMECNREVEIVEAVTLGRWTEGCSEELRRHAESCDVCADVVRVSLALTQKRSEALETVRVPSAGLVWWRSEMRARREAVNKATRPLRIVEWIAVACAFLTVAFVLRWIGPTVLAELLWQPSLLFFVGFGVLILVSTLVFYVVLSRD
jgi:hypothetical protein